MQAFSTPPTEVKSSGWRTFVQPVHWGGLARELIWSEAVNLGIAWPYECHASGPSERDAGDVGFLRELPGRAASGAGVGGVASAIFAGKWAIGRADMPMP